MDNESPRVGEFSPFTEALTLLVIEADTTIRHEDRADIAVFANNPQHWQASNGVVRQVARTPVKTVIMVNEWPVFTIVHRTTFLETVWQVLLSLFDRKRVVVEEPVLVAPLPVVPESPTPLVAALPELEPDELLIIVPLNYAGNLHIDLNGSAPFDIDHWQGDFRMVDRSTDATTIGDIGAGSIEFVLNNGGTCTVGDLVSEGSINFNTTGDAALTTGKLKGAYITGTFNSGNPTDLGDIEASHDVSLNHWGDGKFEVDDISGRAIELVLNGDGYAEFGALTGTYDVTINQTSEVDIETGDIVGVDVSINLVGGSSVTVGGVKAGNKAFISRSGDGDLTVGDIDGKDIELSLSGNGTHSTGYLRSLLDINVYQENDTTVTLGDLQGRNTTCYFSGDRSVDTGVITAANDLKLTRYGDGDIDVDGLCGGDITADMYGGGSHDLGDVKGDVCQVNHNDGDAGLDLDEVDVQSFTLRHSSDAEVVIQRLDTEEIDIECSGEGDVTIHAGSATGGRLYNDGALTLSLTGRFGNVSHDNDGDGRLKVAIEG